MNIIYILHVIFIVLILVTPFTKNTKNLEFYTVLIPFLFFHWSVNDDTCALTEMERYITGKHKNETFMNRLVKPIYKMDDNDINKLFKTVLFALWFYTKYKLGHLNFIPVIGK